MLLKLVNNHIMTMFLLSDEALAEMSLCDEALKYFKAGLGFESPYPIMYGFYKDNELVCCILARPFGECCIEWHPFLATHYQHTGIFNDIHNTLINHLKSNTPYTSMISFAAQACKHAHNAALHYGWEHSGTIPNAIIWRNVKQNLNIYSKEI